MNIWVSLAHKISRRCQEEKATCLSCILRLFFFLSNEYMVDRILEIEEGVQHWKIYVNLLTPWWIILACCFCFQGKAEITKESKRLHDIVTTLVEKTFLLFVCLSDRYLGNRIACFLFVCIFVGLCCLVAYRIPIWCQCFVVRNVMSSITRYNIIWR